MVNYHQSLAFDHPYLSCNDHCDRWLFQEIFFIIIFRSRSKQMFFKTGVTINFAIFRGKHLCWSLFLIKLEAVRAELQSKALQQRLFVLILGFWQWRHVFVHYFMANLMMWKQTGGSIHQVAPWRIPLRWDLFWKEGDLKNFLFIGTNNWIALAVQWSIKYFFY